jgi:hypothetical protein
LIARPWPLAAVMATLRHLNKHSDHRAILQPSMSRRTGFAGLQAGGPLGGQRPHEVGKRGGHIPTAQ